MGVAVDTAPPAHSLSVPPYEKTYPGRKLPVMTTLSAGVGERVLCNPKKSNMNALIHFSLSF